MDFMMTEYGILLTFFSLLNGISVALNEPCVLKNQVVLVGAKDVQLATISCEDATTRVMTLQVQRVATEKATVIVSKTVKIIPGFSLQGLPDEPEEPIVTTKQTTVTTKQSSETTNTQPPDESNEQAVVLYKSPDDPNKQADDPNKSPDDPNKQADDPNKQADDPNKQADDPNKQADDPNKQADDPNKQADDPNKQADDPNKQPDDPNKEADDPNKQADDSNKQPDESYEPPDDLDESAVAMDTKNKVSTRRPKATTTKPKASTPCHYNIDEVGETSAGYYSCWKTDRSKKVGEVSAQLIVVRGTASCETISEPCDVEWKYTCTMSFYANVTYVDAYPEWTINGIVSASPGSLEDDAFTYTYSIPRREGEEIPTVSCTQKFQIRKLKNLPPGLVTDDPTYNGDGCSLRTPEICVPATPRPKPTPKPGEPKEEDKESNKAKDGPKSEGGDDGGEYEGGEYGDSYYDDESDGVGLFKRNDVIMLMVGIRILLLIGSKGTSGV